MLSLPVHSSAALALTLSVLACAQDPGSVPEGRADLGAQIDALADRGTVALGRVQVDPEFPGRRHFRYDHRVGGVRVFGSQLVRQLDAQGRTLSVFGRIDEGLAVDVTPALSADQAVRAAEPMFPPGAYAVGEPELVLLPRGQDRVLTWMLWMRFDHHLDRVFVDARSGTIVWRYSDLRTEAAVGVGRGVWGDRKKISVDSAPSGFRADDQLRPPALTTYDFRYDLGAAGPALSEGYFDPIYVASNGNNTWGDGAVVDAHVYAGWTYDYYFKRHQRRGIDGQNLPVRSVTHFLPRSVDFANAFWDPFQNAMYYGDGDSEFAAFSGALDVVVHEMTHGVTQYTWDGIYSGESGALNEAFSDIMATGAEFFHQPEGSGRHHADYYLGEDLTFLFDPPRMAVRSMENPSLFCSNALAACDPDHYSDLYRGPQDNGGVHHNSGIANQAFYLLVEGGVNRTSGLRVDGLGPGRRGDAERIFYRGFTSYLTPSATFADARAATVQAALDLYGEAEAAQVAMAWTAVGVE
ncbi:MAG: M4 family metallopeptidase [Acidobacteria bacterium]|jgi:Zn-dependent metalloprotease|nr:M4 family metallopeptidase [Acidobacteriota bacterium]